jgi:hypothetical protein
VSYLGLCVCHAGEWLGSRIEGDFIRDTGRALGLWALPVLVAAQLFLRLPLLRLPLLATAPLCLPLGISALVVTGFGLKQGRAAQSACRPKSRTDGHDHIDLMARLPGRLQAEA